MIVSYRWLGAVAPGLCLTPDEVVERLAQRGAPVESVEDLGAQFAGLLVARVTEVGKHPDADRLSLCTVDAGGGETLQVVCGAPNVRAGAWYPFAPVGAVLPDGLKIKKAKIRGVHSQGMLCSERELGLGRDHAGILELKGDFSEGQSLTDALGMDDVRFDIEVSPNRGDLLSHLGVARELAPEGHAGLTFPEISERTPYTASLSTDSIEVVSGGFSLRIEEPDLCPRFLAIVLRGVRVAPSPPWLANRLRAVGSQPINNVVDITNYAMLEMGHPMHAYDLDNLVGSEIVVRLAQDGQSVETLDGVSRQVTADMLMVCDGSGPVAIGGIMGGSTSEVSDQTVNILLECALWSPPNIRSTRRALDLSTDASYRFERGVDPALQETAIRRAAELIMSVAGGAPDGDLIDVCGRPWSSSEVSLRPARVSHLLGVPFDSEQVTTLLEPLGFVVRSQDDDTLQVTIPGFRTYDVKREVDLIEEVARTFGYDAFPEEMGSFRPGTVPDHPLFELEDRLRKVLSARGLLEAQVPAFASESEGEVALNNPISSNDSHMRRWLLPGLTRRTEYNFSRGTRAVRLFELGTVFCAPSIEGRPPSEATHLSAVMTGSRAPEHWSTEATDVDIWDMKAVGETVVALAYGPSATVGPAVVDHPTLDEDGLEFTDGKGQRVGYVGRVRSDSVDAPAWAGRVWALEMALPDHPALDDALTVVPLPDYPGVDRDLALLIPSSIPVDQVKSLIEVAGGASLSSVEVFDLYEGDELPAGHRSVAHRLRFQSSERTLTDKEVERSIGRVLRKLKEELGVETRG